MTKPHVLILPSGYPSFHAPLDGIFYRDQALALSREGLKVGVIDNNNRSFRTITDPRDIWRTFQVRHATDEGVATLKYYGWRLPHLSRIDAPMWCRRGLKLIKHYIRHFGRPDILHAHCTLWGGVLAADAKKVWGLPYCITEHSSHYPLNRIQDWQTPRMRIAFEEADAVIAVSSFMAQSLRQRLPGLVVNVVPNLVDTSFFDLPAQRHTNPEFNFTTIAGLSDIKDIALQIKAFKQAFGKTESVKLTVGGEGALADDLKAFAESLGIARKVIFLGRLDRMAVRKALHAADCYITSSLIETFGVMLIEAMATGLPIISTDCGGPRDIVIPEVGYLTEVGDVDGMARRMRQIYGNRDSWRGRSANIRAHSVNRYGEHAVSRQLLNVYESVMQ